MNTFSGKNNTPPLHQWEKFIPSKKILAIVGIIIVVAIIYGLRNPLDRLIQKIKSGKQVSITTIQPKTEQSPVTLSVDKDTDGDGLPDWQEVLLGTNPNVPNSKDDVPQSLRELVNSSDKTLITTSDKLALKVYQRLESAPKGSNITEAVQAATTKEMLDYANSLDQQMTTYALNDLNLVDNTADARTSYSAAIAPEFKKIIPDASQTQQIYQQILGNTQKIIPSSYEIGITKVVNDLLQMPVPLRLSENHLILLNAVTHLQGALKSQNSATTDQTDLYAMFLVFQKNLNLAIQSATALDAMLH